MRRVRTKRSAFGVGLVLLVALVISAPGAGAPVGTRAHVDHAIVHGARTGADLDSVTNDVHRLRKAVDWDKKVKALGHPAASLDTAPAEMSIAGESAVGHLPLEPTDRFAGRGPPTFG